MSLNFYFHMIFRNIFFIVFCSLISIVHAVPSCSITTTTLAFGSIDPLSSSQISSTASIALNCTGGPVSYSIGLSKGNGTITQRKMLSGSNSLQYNIFSSSAYTTVVGDDTSGSQLITGSFSTDPSSATHTLYGRISSASLFATFPGTYTDTIVVTLSY